MTKIFINLTDARQSADEFLPGEKDLIIWQKLADQNLEVPSAMSLTILREILLDLEKSPNFDTSNDVLIISRPIIQSFGLIWGIKAAFTGRVKIWFTRDQIGYYMDLSDFEAEGHDFQQTHRELRIHEILTKEGFGDKVEEVGMMFESPPCALVHPETKMLPSSLTSEDQWHTKPSDLDLVS